LWGLSPDVREILADGSGFLNKTKIKEICRPTLIIHGEDDEIIPVNEAEELYEASGAEDKMALIIPRAGHNDIMMNNSELYFGTIAEFVNKHNQSRGSNYG